MFAVMRELCTVRESLWKYDNAAEIAARQNAAGVTWPTEAVEQEGAKVDMAKYLWCRERDMTVAQLDGQHGEWDPAARKYGAHGPDHLAWERHCYTPAGECSAAVSDVDVEHVRQTVEQHATHAYNTAARSAERLEDMLRGPICRMAGRCSVLPGFWGLIPG